MKKSKRLISLLLSVVMLMSVINTGFVAFAADATGYVLGADEAEMLPDAGAVTTSTQVVRVASGLESYQPGSTIVAATPSGIPAVSGTFAESYAYANVGSIQETASYPMVKITFKELPENTPMVTCINSNSNAGNITMSQPEINSQEKSYTWFIASGTANAGDTLTFKITYTYNGKQYVSNAYSYVETVSQPAGNEVSTVLTYEPEWLDKLPPKYEKDTHAGISAVTRVLGINTYGSLGNFSTSSSDTRGYYDASNNKFVSNSGLEYSTYSVSRSGKDVSFMINDRRSYADVYVDTSVTNSLADLNLRYAVAMMKTEAENNTQKLDAVSAKHGNVSVGSDITGTANVELGLDADLGLMNVGTQHVTAFTGSTLINNAEYTIISQLSSSSGKAGNVTAFPVGLRIHTVNKGELRALINDILHNNTPESPLATAQYKGVNPQSWYYSAGFSQYETAMLNAQTVLQNPRATQDEINNAVVSLTSAYNGLVLKEADYSAVVEAQNEALAYEDTKHLYTEESYAELMKAVSVYDADTNPDGVIQFGYSVLYQPQVDLWKTGIENAINGLKYRRADYTELDELYEEAKKIMESAGNYTDTSAVEAAINKIEQNQNVEIINQTKVDQMAYDLRVALDNLKYTGADYSAVNAAKERAQEKKEIHYTADSYAELRRVLNSIDYTLDLSQQDVVDGYVTQIDEAISKLVELPANYIELEALLNRIANLVEEYYSEDSYNAAKAAAAACAGYEKIGITKQDEVDAMRDSLQAAIDNLELKDADYEEIENLKAEFEAKDKSQMTAESITAVQNAINKVEYGLKADRQYEVDNWADKIRDAIDKIKYEPANYTQVQIAVTNAGNIDRTYYSAESIARLDSALARVEYGYDINRQDEVDLMALNINEALQALQPGPADYSRVIAAIERFNALNHSHYTSVSVANVQNVINGINWELTKKDQGIVNGYAFDISDMMYELVEAKGNYTELRRIRDYDIPKDLSKYTTDTVKDLNNVLNSIDWNLNAKDQDKIVQYQIALTEAINNLKPIPGDYTAVDEAIAEGRALIANGNIDKKDADAFEKFVSEINRGYTFEQQEEIAKLAAEIRARYEKFSASESVHKATIELVADKKDSYHGDIVTVSVIVGTDYYAAATSIPVVYDSNFFELVGETPAEAFAFEGSFAAASITGGNINSPDKGYPSSYTESEKNQYKYALVTIAPDPEINDDAQILDPAQTVVKLQFRVKDLVALNGKIWVDDAFLKTDENKTGKLFIGRYRTSLIDNDVVNVGQTIDTTKAVAIVNAKDPNAAADFTELMKAINKNSELLNKAYYTTESYKVYTDAYNEALEVYMNKGDYTVKEQGEVDAVTAALNKAFAELELLPVDKTPLEEALALVPEYDSDKYIDETYEEYQKAVIAGEELYANEELTVVDNERIKAAADAIQSAFENLTLKPFSYQSMMENALETIPEYDASFYEEESYNAYQQAYDALTEFSANELTILDDDAGLDLITQVTITYNRLTLKPADTTPLEEALNADFEYKDEADYYYTEETYGEYQSAVDAGNELLAKPDLSVVDNEDILIAADNIYAAIDMLEFKPFSYQEDIDIALGEWFYEGGDDEYTPESVENFWMAYEELAGFWGEDIRDDAEGLRLLNQLRDALDNMQYLPADLALLEEALALEVYDEEYYEEGTYQAYKDAIAMLDEYGADYYWTLAEQDIVDEIAYAIMDAHALLELKPFSYYEEVDNALATAPEYDEYFYTEDSYQAYQEAYDALVEFSANELTIIDDAEALELIDSLNEKLEALALKPVDKTPLEEAINTPLEYDASFYTEETYAEYQAKVEAGNAILAREDLTFADNDDIIAAADEILTAIENLAFKPFSMVDELENAIAVTPEYPENYYIPEVYAEYVKALEAIENMIADADNLTILDDAKALEAIDNYNAALEALKTAWVDADYSDVEAAIDEAEALDRDIYTNFEIVDEAIANVVYGLNIHEQETVNGYAAAIREAIGNLEAKSADYTVVEDAKTAANEKLSEMQSTGIELDQSTVDALNNAINDVVYDLDITKQDVVQGYADAIVAATEALDFVSTIVLKDDATAFITEEGYIRGLADIWSDEEIISQFDVYGKNTSIVVTPTANGYGTGTLVQHFDGEELVKEYVIVIDGDANGDAFVDAIDVTIVAGLINEFEEPETEYIMAAIDLENDGWLDAIDLTIVINIANMAF